MSALIVDGVAILSNEWQANERFLDERLKSGQDFYAYPRGNCGYKITKDRKLMGSKQALKEIREIVSPQWFEANCIVCKYI